VAAFSTRSAQNQTSRASARVAPRRERAVLAALPAITSRSSTRRSPVSKTRKGRVQIKDPAASIRSKIPPPGTIQQRGHIPVQAWAYLFMCTLEDLQRIDPHLAELRWRDFQNVYHSWVMVVRDWSAPKQWRWLEEILREMRRPYGRGFKTTGRRFEGLSDRRLLLARHLAKNGKEWGPRVVADALKAIARGPARKKLSYRKASTALEVWADFIDPPPSNR
jgi:hypothetical protein